MITRPKNKAGVEVLSMPTEKTPPETQPDNLSLLFNAIWNSIVHLHNDGTLVAPKYLGQGGLWSCPEGTGTKTLVRVDATKDLKLFYNDANGVELPFGYTAQLIATPSDLNTIRNEGLYRFVSSASNVPEKVTSGFLWVMRSAAGVYTQLILSDSSIICIRTATTTGTVVTWGDWKSISGNGDSGNIDAITLIVNTAVSRGQLSFAANPVSGSVLDDFKNPGFYYFSSSRVPTGWPAEAGVSGIMQVIVNSNQEIVKQIIYRTGTIGTTSRFILYRSHLEGKWDSWTRLDNMTLEQNVTGLTNDLELLIGDVATTKSSVTNLQTEATAKWVILNNTETAVIAIIPRVTAAETNIATITPKITASETAIAALTPRISTVENLAASHTTSITGHETRIAKLESVEIPAPGGTGDVTTAQMNAAIAAATAPLDTRITGNTTKITTLETSLGSIDTALNAIIGETI